MPHPQPVPATDDDLLSRHRAVLPSWLALYYEHPIEIVSGSGRHVTDAAGRTYLDFFAGILTNAVGYDIAEISDAIRRQIDTGVLHTSTLFWRCAAPITAGPSAQWA